MKGDSSVKLEELVKRIDLRFVIQSLEISVSPSDPPTLEFNMVVPHRDTGETICIRSNDLGESIFSAYADPVEYVREALQRFVLHELDECLYVDGERRWDPHK